MDETGERKGGPAAAAADLRAGGEEARREAASVLGSARTEAKADAARENGKKGGRPKGVPMSPEARERIRQGRLAAAAKRRAEREGGTG